MSWHDPLLPLRKLAMLWVWSSIPCPYPHLVFGFAIGRKGVRIK